MIKALSEKDMIELMSLEHYEKLRNKIYQAMVQSESFKKSKLPVCFSIQTFNVGEGEFFHIESAVKRSATGKHGFQITKCVLTDELDFTFDRWNATKKKLGTTYEFTDNQKK
jgi:hypothetical protein